jgi:hypothetical protein
MDQIKTLGGQRISFFEMIPQNELQKYFRQGLSYIVNIYTSHYDSLIKFRYFTNEIVLVCELLIQSFYLWRKKATYSEFFFGFRRSVADQKTRILTPLRNWHIVLTLVFECLMPYLKHKLTKAFEENEWLKAKKGVKRIFDVIVYASEMSLFVYQFRYLVNSKT